MKIKYKRDSSRRRTPWDNQDSLTPMQDLIKERYLEAYEARHPSIRNSKEIDLLNSFNFNTCKFCDCDNIRKIGFTDTGIQRYFCNECRRSFTPLTSTIFDNGKVSITEWIEFCLDLFRYESLNVTSKNNKNAASTTRYWLKKLFLLLEDYQESFLLSGKNVYIDETFYPVIESEKVTKDGKQLRGLSKNLYCIGIGFDGTNTIAILEGTGKTSIPKTLNAFSCHIEPGSHLIHDKEKSHKSLVSLLDLTEDVYDAGECKKLDDKNNPLDPINKQCFFLKKFLDSHSGFNRNDLQDYLNLFCFIVNPPKDKLQKVEVLLSSAMNGARKLKYRDFYKQNNKK